MDTFQVIFSVLFNLIIVAKQLRMVKSEIEKVKVGVSKISQWWYTFIKTWDIFWKKNSQLI